MRYLILIIFVLSSAISFSQMDDKGTIKMAFKLEDVNKSFEDIITITYYHVEKRNTITDIFLLKAGEKIPYRLFEVGKYTIEVSGNKIPGFIITGVPVRANIITIIDDINLNDYPDKNATIHIQYKSPTGDGCG
ncbi:MAG: hypothetical protein PHQ74_09780 [Crocinitomicaceae bacterium]|nr:hypothetical protein [Crocinitomicaceae bacterium]